jgi:hypothetical protein
MEKIIIFFFVLSCLFFVREIYLFIQSTLKNRTLIDSEILPYSVPFLRLIGLWISVGYIITILICGF